MFQFRVIARPQGGRGNLKVVDMEFQSEAREQETTKSRKFNLSQGDTAIATLLGRYIMRPTGRISYAQAYIIQL